MSQDEIRSIELWIGHPLPESYKAFLDSSLSSASKVRGFCYSAADVIERNQTFESRAYCPGFIAIGDDGGGRAFVIPLEGRDPPVFVVPHGSMSPDDMQHESSTLSRWLEGSAFR